MLVCTDAAAEGLNFQFCGALINYDMPWNPMRVEQRIGRIDRLGQKFADIRISNLHYRDTVEADVYQALRGRISLFENVVGGLQPILTRLPTLISGRVLEGRTKAAEERRAVVAEIEREADQVPDSEFDIDAVTDADLEEPVQAPSPMTMEDLDRIISTTKLLPPGIEVRALGSREYAFNQPGLGGRSVSLPTRRTTNSTPTTLNYGRPAIRRFPPRSRGSRNLRSEIFRNCWTASRYLVKIILKIRRARDREGRSCSAGGFLPPLPPHPGLFQGCSLQVSPRFSRFAARDRERTAVPCHARSHGGTASAPIDGEYPHYRKAAVRAS